MDEYGYEYGFTLPFKGLGYIYFFFQIKTRMH